jgi:beta-lactamase regulating signal transducer with metallopeptidase domain
MMTEFLLLLGKLNLAMGAAIVVVCLLRRPLRAQFGAPITYALWLLVPIAGLASLLPPRTAAPLPAHFTSLQILAAPMSAATQIAHPVMRITEHLAAPSAPAMIARAAAWGPLDYATLFFTAWALGAMLMALYLVRLQVRFHAAAQLGEAGPAVVGFLRPRIVMPDSFQEQFTAAEQAAILAHERVHLARQDARINAVTALLRCLCWFNPLVHLGAVWIRMDQELACDATALRGPVSRHAYASALLKSQMTGTALPLGCNWPGSEHPLIERIALLKRKPPGKARRITGMGLVLFAATFAGLGAWAVQPPVAAKPMAARQLGVALAMLPAIVAAPSQAAGDTSPNQPVANANPASSGNDVDMSKHAPGSAEQALPPATEAPSGALPANQVAINRAARLAFQINEAATTSADPATRLPAAPPLHKEVSASETGAASNDPPATPVQPRPNASPAVALSDQPVAPIQPTARDLSVGSVQAALSTPPATPTKTDSNEPYLKKTCNEVPDNTVTGRVTSSTMIQMPKFSCGKNGGSADGPGGQSGGGGKGGDSIFFNMGRCNVVKTYSSIWGRVCPSTPWLTMTVQLANSADASKMPLGKLVTLKGDFFVITKNKVSYLFVQNAKVLYADPFGR